MHQSSRAKKDNIRDGKVERRFLHPAARDELELAHEAGAIKYEAYNKLLEYSVLRAGCFLSSKTNTPRASTVSYVGQPNCVYQYRSIRGG